MVASSLNTIAVRCVCISLRESMMLANVCYSTYSMHVQRGELTEDLCRYYHMLKVRKEECAYGSEISFYVNLSKYYTTAFYK